MRPTDTTPARPGSGWRAPVPAPQSARPTHPALRPALWLVVLLLAAGAWRVGSLLRLSFMEFPVASTSAIIIFALYAVPFLLLLRLIDYLARAPVVLQAVALAWGGLVATSAAIAGGSAVQNILAKTVSPAYAAQWGPAVAGAAIEELLKALGVVAIALLARGQLTSLVDGFVYGALVGLGFQVVENCLYSVNAVALQGEDSVLPVVATFLLRGFMAGIWSHTLFTALAGAAVAYLLIRRDRPAWRRWLVAGALFGVAWGAHFLWNSPVLEDGFGYGLAGVFAALVVKAIPALVVGVSLIVAAERRQADYYAALLAGLGDPRIASRDEIAALISPRRRVALRRRARLRLGRAGAVAVRRLQSAQAKLAVALSRNPCREPGPDVLKRRRDVLVRRHELLAKSLVAADKPRRNGAAMTAAQALAYTLLTAAVLAALARAIQSLTP